MFGAKEGNEMMTKWLKDARTLKTGDAVTGGYHGVEFTGRVHGKESDRSGHRGFENDARLIVTLDAPIVVYSTPRQAGERIQINYDARTGRIDPGCNDDLCSWIDAR